MNASIWVYISVGVAIGIGLVIVAMALAVIRALFNGTIDLKYLLSESASPMPQAVAQAKQIPVEGAEGQDPAAADEPKQQPPETPKASASRFQMVMFTFVIAGVYLVLCLESGTMLDIPPNVLWLLGVSSSTYAASKVIKTAGDSNTANAGQ